MQQSCSHYYIDRFKNPKEALKFKYRNEWLLTIKTEVEIQPQVIKLKIYMER